jgi:hypothetical protein
MAEYWWESQKERDNTKMDLRVIGIECDGVDWVDMAQDRDQWGVLANTVMNLRFP